MDKIQFPDTESIEIEEWINEGKRNHLFLEPLPEPPKQLREKVFFSGIDEINALRKQINHFKKVIIILGAMAGAFLALLILEMTMNQQLINMMTK